MTLLELRDIHKSFVTQHDMLGRASVRVDAVRGVSVDIGEAETVAVVGESGSGKSTLARIAMRLLEPDSGQVVLRGTELTKLGRRDMRRIRPTLQMVFQDPYTSLDPRMVIADQIVEPLRVHRIVAGTTNCRARAAELLARVGLSAKQLEKYPYEMSGGQLQRVAIARALATNPRMLVCDEPVAALDMSIRAQVINLLQDLQEESGISMLFISHDLSLVQFLAHRVFVMYKGQFVEAGVTAEVFSAPQHEYTKALLAAVPNPDPSHRSLGRESIPIEQV